MSSTKPRWECARLLPLLLLLPLSAITPAQQAQPSIRVAFRFDDYSATSDLEKDLRIVAMFRERGLPVTFAVVPFSRGERLEGERADLLREWVSSGVVDPALHGHRHENIATDGTTTEFRGRDAADQVRIIQAGKTLLDRVTGTDVRVFVPPWNNYDEATLAGLRAAGIDVMSAMVGPPHDPSGAIRFVPFTAYVHEYRDAVAQARNSAALGREVSVVLLSHVYELTDSATTPQQLHGGPGNYSFTELEELLDWTRAQPDLTVCRLPELARTITASSSEAYLEQRQNSAAYMRETAWLRDIRQRLVPAALLPPLRDPLRRTITYPTLAPEPGESIRATELALGLVPVLGFYVPVWLAVFVAGSLLRPLWARRRTGLRRSALRAVVSLPLLLLVLAGIARGTEWGHLRALVAVASVALLCAVLDMVPRRSGGTRAAGAGAEHPA